MVTRSIVGRVLILAVLIVSLGVIAQAALIITHGPAKKNGVTQPRNGADARRRPAGYGTDQGRLPRAARRQSRARAQDRRCRAGFAASGRGAARRHAVLDVVFRRGDRPGFRFAGGLRHGRAKAVTPSPLRRHRPPRLQDAEAPPAARRPRPSRSPRPTPDRRTLRPVPADRGDVRQGRQHQQCFRRNPQPPARRRSDRPDRSFNIGPTSLSTSLVKKRVLRRAVYDQIKNQIAAQ